MAGSLRWHDPGRVRGSTHPTCPPTPTGISPTRTATYQTSSTTTTTRHCHTAYRAASETTKKQPNHAIFAHITLRNGHIDQWEYHPPFDAIFDTTWFEYGTQVDLPGRCSNLTGQIESLEQAVASCSPAT